LLMAFARSSRIPTSSYLVVVPETRAIVGAPMKLCDTA
jgi:hypothetical protein